MALGAKPTRVFLIRHAETEWNATLTFQGRLDSAVTAAGLKQAEALAERLASEGIEVLYSSDQGRAMRTAQIAGARLGLEVLLRPDLREIDCGQWTGKSYQEVRDLWPEGYSDWRERPDRHRMPGGETVAEVQQRGLRFVEEVRRLHAGHAVCAVTHNTVVRAVLCHLRGLPLARLWDGNRVLNCSINLVDFQNGRVDLVELNSPSSPIE